MTVRVGVWQKLKYSVSHNYFWGASRMVLIFYLVVDMGLENMQCLHSVYSQIYQNPVWQICI